MNDFVRILAYVRRYSGYALLNLLFNLLTVLFSLVSIVMIIPFLQLLFGKKPPVYEAPVFAVSPAWLIDYFYYGFSHYIRNFGAETALIYLCLLVAAVFFLKNMFRFLALYMLAPLRNGVVRDLRTDMYAKVLELPLAYYTKEKKGDLIARMTEDVKEVEYSIMSFLEVSFREPITIITFLTAMIVMSPELTGFVFAMLLVTGLIIGQVGKSLKKQSGEAQQRSGDLVTILDETLGGLRIIHAFNAERFKLRYFAKANQELYSVSTRMQSRRDLSSPLTEFLAIGVVCMVLWFGGRLVLSKESISPETFIGFMVIFSQVIPPAKNFSNAFYHIQKGLASSARIYELLDAGERIEEPQNPVALQSFQHSIRFSGVHFSYHRIDDKAILEDINLVIEKGKMVALVGQSGAGKSTLVDLLPRFYDVEKGAIYIDGTDIRQFALKDLRRLFGIVTQESILFNDTVFNNIAFGIDGVSMPAVEEAARIANAHDFICKMPLGYQTPVGDRGSKLSGGERQRLTIARAILKNPPILILDEATSSLDSNSEKLVQEALHKLMKGRTTIVIAHRLSTIQFADEIVVLQDGKIAEKGNHIGLLARNGLYKHLVELQAF